MYNLYDVIASLCAKEGITPGKMCADIGISRGLITDLKMGRKQKPTGDTLFKIASYFGVTVDYLLTGEQKEAPALTKKDERDIARAVEHIMGDLENSGDLMFDGVPMSPEAKESMAAAMKLGLEAARLKNKETYAPKRFRKE